MANTPKRLIEGEVLTASAAAYFTALDSTRVVIRRLVLNNSTAAPVACAVYLVPSGGSPLVENQCAAPVLAAGESRTITEAEGQVLEEGDTIQALGLGVTIMASGVEVTP